MKRLISIAMTGWLCAAMLLPQCAQAASPKLVYLITNRGCEDVCHSFMHSLESRGPVFFLQRDAQGDTARVAQFVAEARRLHPDLIATWGTGITLAVVGPYGAASASARASAAASAATASAASAASATPAAATNAYVSDIPVVYMYVGNPVESGIARDAQHSGRPNVAGANTSVPMDEQINLLASYRKIGRVGMLYNANEPAAVAQAASARQAFEARGLQVTELRLPLDAAGRPNARDIPAAVAQLAADRPDFLYQIGSTFALEQVGAISDDAIAHGIPMFTSSEPAFRDGNVLLGLVSSLAAIGEVAAYQAGQILFEGKHAGDLATPTVTRHSVFINMRAARALKLYPPMKLLQFAELSG